MAARKLLVVRQDKLGDLLMTTPLLRGLSEHANVDLIAQPAWKPIWERLDFLREVLPTPYRLGPVGAFRLGAQLRKLGYDAVILAKENSGDHLLAARVAGIPMRVGHATKHYAKWLTHRVTPPDAHEVLRLDAYGRQVLPDFALPGPLEFPTRPNEEAHAAALLPAGDWIICAPATGGTCPAWEPAGWRALLDALERNGARTAVVGAPGEEAIAQAVTAGSARGNLAGKLTLGELAAVMKRATYVLSGNTGALHVAASQRTPSLVIETQPEGEYYARRWGPWQTEAVHVMAAGKTHEAVVADAVARAALLPVFN